MDTAFPPFLAPCEEGERHLKSNLGGKCIRWERKKKKEVTAQKKWFPPLFLSQGRRWVDLLPHHFLLFWGKFSLLFFPWTSIQFCTMDLPPPFWQPIFGIGSLLFLLQGRLRPTSKVSERRKFCCPQEKREGSSSQFFSVFFFFCPAN